MNTGTQRPLADRLVELRAELVEGRRALASLDARRDELVAGLLRVEGAVQILEELMAEPATEPATAAGG
jgi:hypothetical protein